MSIRSGFVALLVATSCAAAPKGGAVTGPAPAGGAALMVVGTIPLVGTDVQIREALQARNLKVEEVLETTATPGHAAGKQVVVLSFSMLSTSFKAEDLADLPVPLIVMEHNLLPRLA